MWQTGMFQPDKHPTLCQGFRWSNNVFKPFLKRVIMCMMELYMNWREYSETFQQKSLVYSGIVANLAKTFILHFGHKILTILYPKTVILLY